MIWLQCTAAVCGAIAAVVSFVRFGKTKNKGHLFLGGCFLLVAGVFGYLVIF